MDVKCINLPFTVKAVDEDKDENIGIIEGYAAGIGNVDHGRDRIQKGAFRKTIKEKKGKWPVLADHSVWDQIGFNVEASEDDHGLKIKEEINLDVAKGAERYSLAKQALKLKVPFGMSIGYDAVKVAFEEDEETGQQIRILKEIRMWEHSHVTFPMNESAFVTAAKNFEFDSIDGMIKSIIERSEKCGKKPKEIIQRIKSILESYTEPGTDELVHSLKSITEVFNQ
jgi:HK97 family phage prohead protease